MLVGGSRSGKTFLLVYAILVRSLKCKSRHVILRKHFSHAKQSVWLDTIPKVIDLCFPALKGEVKYNQTDWFLQIPNGSEIWVGGLDDKERTEKILGKEFSTIYFNESSEISYSSMNIAMTRLAEKNDLVKKIYFDCNPPKQSHWVYNMFIALRDHESNEPHSDPSDYASLFMNPVDNMANIDPDYIEKVLMKLPLKLRERFLEGRFGYDDTDIFPSEWLFPSEKLPEKHEIAAIFGFCDPAITERARKTDSTCESGIVVLALDYQGVLHEIEVLHGFWSYFELKEKIEAVWKRYREHKECFLGLEDVAFQKGLGMELEQKGVHMDYIKPDADKVSRAITITDIIEKGMVRINSLSLRKQLIEFPGEKFKDLVDAFVYAVKLYKRYAKDIYNKKEDKYAHLDPRSKDFWKSHFKELEGGQDYGSELHKIINL